MSKALTTISTTNPRRSQAPPFSQENQSWNGNGKQSDDDTNDDNTDDDGNWDIPLPPTPSRSRARNYTSTHSTATALHPLIARNDRGGGGHARRTTNGNLQNDMSSSSFQYHHRISAWSKRLGETLSSRRRHGSYHRNRRLSSASLLFGDSDYSYKKQTSNSRSNNSHDHRYYDADPDLDMVEADNNNISISNNNNNNNTTTMDYTTYYMDETSTSNTNSSTTLHKPSGWAGFLFGFMYEEPSSSNTTNDDSSMMLNLQNDLSYDEQTTPESSIWSTLNIALFVAYTLTSAAAAVPVVAIPTIGQEFLLVSSSSSSFNTNEYYYDNSNNTPIDWTTAMAAQASAFASRAAASAVMGTACGKFINGPVVDVWGARKTLVVYSIFLSMALIRLASCGSTECAISVCFYVEFCYSVVWPCTVVILATHFKPQNPMYEGGIYITSIASRLGSLLGIPLYFILLRRSHWRIVCLVGAWVAIIGASVIYLFVTDSPHHVNMPQNKLDKHLLQQMASITNIRAQPGRFLWIVQKLLRSMILDNLVPSFRHVLQSGTFWIVALAHTGSSLIRTSERILGTYYRDTSMGTLSENRSGALAAFLSLGTISGLVIAGSMFAHRNERQRKWLVSRLYMITIAACYSLTILSIPRLRYMVNAPDLILSFQVMATFIMGFGISVMFYHIPGLVGAAFGQDKGLFLSYTDGVAYGVASIVWRIVGNAVAHGDTETGGGWAYGWAAVALIIVLCSILMVEFMEHYFVRGGPGRHPGTYETIIFA